MARNLVALLVAVALFLGAPAFGGSLDNGTVPGQTLNRGLFNGGAVLDLNFLSASLDSRVTFTRASSATFFDVTGTLQTATTNTPRFDFDPNSHVLNGLLIESARTNSLLNSGTPATQTTASLATGTYTLWLVGTGSATSSAGTATATGLGAASAGSPNVFTVTVAGTITVTVSGSPTRFQLENGSSATSYIPTTAATVTRAADIASIATSSFGWNTAAGSSAAEFIISAVPTVQQYLISPGGGAQVLFMTAAAKASVYDGAAGQATSANSVTSGGVLKAASAWGTSSAVVLSNSTVATGTWSNTIMAAQTSLSFGSGVGLNMSPQIWFRRVRIFNRMLTNAAIQALTQ